MNTSLWLSISGLAVYIVIWGINLRHHRAAQKVSNLRHAKGSCNMFLGRKGCGREFHGALEGFSNREALSAPLAASLAQTVIERVTGTLHGLSGSFLLKDGAMTDDGTSFVVVPGSGTGDLTGISGSMTLHFDNGDLSYDFEYRLETPKQRRARVRQPTQTAPDERQGDVGQVLRLVPHRSTG